MEIKNYGFVSPYIKSKELVLGANTTLPSEIILPDRKWSKFYEDDEIQFNDSFDTSNCTGQGSVGQIQAYLRHKFNVSTQYSKRAVGILAGTRPPGNSPQIVYDAIHKNGLLPEGFLSLDNSLKSIEEYYSPDPLTQELKDELKKWEFELWHDWVFYPTATIKYKQEKILEALQFSPVAVSVVAWKERNGLYYKEIGEPDTHWIQGITDFEIGQWWEIEDSYPPFRKKLEWDYDFGFAKRILITQKVAKKWFSMFKCHV